MARKPQSKGACVYCGEKVAKGGISKHGSTGFNGKASRAERKKISREVEGCGTGNSSPRSSTTRQLHCRSARSA